MFLRGSSSVGGRANLYRVVSPRLVTPPSQTLRYLIPRTMSHFKQAPHKLLVIPGPIEVSDEVLYANAHPSMSHTSPEFIPVFGDCIRMIREVVFAPTAQPFLISGSGTLGWDQVSANLVEPGENALVLHTGYFGDSFSECLETYGAKVDQLKAEIGQVVSQVDLEKALKAKKYKVVTVTHVDTSTAVLSDIKSVSATVRRISPETLVVVDAVCSVASEEIRMDEWDIDIVLSAGQKGLSIPPGLSVLLASPRAIKVYETRSTPVASYYSSWKKWLPIMRAYEKGTAAYFATPPVNMIYAFHASLTSMTRSSSVTIEDRLRLHKEASARVREAATSLGLKQVAGSNNAANGMTALYFPEGFTASDILPRLNEKGVVMAGGLHKDIKDKYFRIGHMGVTVVDKSRGDMDKIIDSLKTSIEEAKEARKRL